MPTGDEPSQGDRLRVAVIGAGVSGLTCAHLLGPEHDVTVFEADARLGGHTNTVDVIDPEAGPLAVDTGFIVHNDRNYPNLIRLFDRLGVAVQDSEMSFSVTDDATGLTYRATNPATLLARPRNAVDPRFHRMLFDIVRFYRAGRRHLVATDDPDRSGAVDLTIGEFLDRGRYHRSFVDLHLLPMGAAVWSISRTEFRSFPLITLLRFLENHGLLGIGDRPTWRTVVGGSRVYVDAIAAAFPGTIRTATPVRRVVRAPAGSTDRAPVVVVTDRGSWSFDRVIMACHSDQTLRLLAEPTPDERSVLGAIGYRPNRAVLHTDTSVLSPARRAWAAWNYRIAVGDDEAIPPTLTYDMTNLQRLPGANRYLVSINPPVDRQGEPIVSGVLGAFDYAHPQLTIDGVRAQRRFDEIDGAADVHFCGAYWGYGFHEDGVNSALRVCRKLGTGWDPDVGLGLER